MSKLRVQEIEILGPAGKAGVPIGHPYFQLPGMPEPSAIYTGTWENVSDQYPGDFFRVEGGEALAFDASNLSEQLDQMHGHWHAFAGSTLGAGTVRVMSNTSVGYFSGANQIWSASATKGGVQLAIDDNVNGTPRTGAETRGINRTIRIWKRIS